MTTKDLESLTAQELGDLLIDVAAKFYSLEVVDDLQSLINTLIAAKAHLERVRDQRRTLLQRSVSNASRTVHQKGPNSQK